MDKAEILALLHSARTQHSAAVALRLSAQSAGDEAAEKAAHEKIEECDDVIRDLEAILASSRKTPATMRLLHPDMTDEQLQKAADDLNGKKG